MSKSSRHRSLSIEVGDSLGSESKVGFSERHPDSLPSRDTYGNGSYMGIIDIRPGTNEYGYPTPSRVSQKKPMTNYHNNESSFIDIRNTNYTNNYENYSAETESRQMPKPSSKFRKTSTFTERWSMLTIWRTRRVWLLLIPMGVIIALYVFLIAFSLDEVNDEVTRSNWNSPKVADDPPRLKIDLRIVGVDVLKNKVETRIYFYPSNSLAKRWAQLDVPVGVYFRYQNLHFPANGTMDPIDVIFPILSGSYYYYPFDSFKMELAVVAADLATNELIPLDVGLYVNTPSLWFDISRQNGPDSNMASNEIVAVALAAGQNSPSRIFRFSIKISRPDFVVFFSVFVIMVMWALTLSVMGVQISASLLNPDRPKVGYIALGPALLFAMPNLRDVQPGVPPIGVMIDVIGFFW